MNDTYTLLFNKLNLQICDGNCPNITEVAKYINLYQCEIMDKKNIKYFLRIHHNDTRKF